METQFLRDPDHSPEKDVLENVLKESYLVYDELIKTITASDIGLVPQWNYYKDGKTWLCKVCYKKKTVFWLSVWDRYFKTGFFFTEKNCPGVENLNIDDNIKADFKNNKHIGRLIPLSIDINRRDQIDDLLKIIEYKKSLK